MSLHGILAVIALVWAPMASPDASPAGPTLIELYGRMAEARAAGDKAGWLEHGQAVLLRAPDHPDLLLAVSRAAAANGQSDRALDLLEDAVLRGSRADVGTLPEYEALYDDPRFAALAAKARANQAPVSPPEVFLTFDDPAIDTEGITWDEDTARLFIGSLHRGIWQVGPDREVATFATAESGLLQVAGLKVDRKRRLLWAATGVFPDPRAAQPDPDTGRTALLAFSLDDGERVRACWLDERPVERGFNDMALAANGDVYASDSANNAIYRLPAGGCRYERVVEDPGMSFPNGIALSADEALLYVAHIEGLSVVDLKTGLRTPLAVPADASVNSMDGLVRDGADLIGIQPSPNLARVLRIRLDDGGTAIREVLTVSSPPPEGLSPTTGTVVGDHYYFVASVIDPEVQDRRPRILRARLR